MKKRSLFLLMVVLSAMFAVSVSSVSAQDTDIDSMTNEQLLLLMQSILQKLEQGETSVPTDETAPSEAAAGPLAVNETETGLFEIYENKKLIVEALPSYMFIQPTQAPKPEKGPNKPDNGGSNNNDDTGFCPPRTPCKPGSDIYCNYYITPAGNCVCMCG